jgi:hypothetical protein
VSRAITQRIRASTFAAHACWTANVLLLANCDGNISAGSMGGNKPVDPQRALDSGTATDATPTSTNESQANASGGRSGAEAVTTAGKGGRTADAGDPSNAGRSGSAAAAASGGMSGRSVDMTDPPMGGAGVGGASGASASAIASDASYTVTGSWPQRAIAIQQRPGTLVFTKVKVDDRFLAESCSIGDYNRDGTPDISAGRRWYEGPFGPSGATKEHIFRAGHDALPRTGDSLDELDTGVSDDWACYAQDVDADGYTDIINITCPDMNDDKALGKATRQHAGTAVWYKNPGKAIATSTAMWRAYPMHDDVRGEQHGLSDLNGDGKPEIYGACKGCGNTDDTTITRGFYQMDPAHPTAAWTYHAVTKPYLWPGGGWLHGFGFGDVNLDGKVDLLERAGVWTNVLAPAADTAAYYDVRLYGDGMDDGKLGGSHMFTTDVDGDSDMDIISSDMAHGYGISWYEQTSPGKFKKHKFAGTPQEDFPISFSQPHAMEVVDMDGDGVADVIVGKTYLAHPEGLDNPDPDLRGEPVSFVFKVKRGVPSEAGSVTFEPHPIDNSNAKVGIGRQIAVGHINTDGVMDICIASKLGVYVFLGQ